MKDDTVWWQNESKKNPNLMVVTNTDNIGISGMQDP
jgi:hypothetical protein